MQNYLYDPRVFKNIKSISELKKFNDNNILFV